MEAAALCLSVSMSRTEKHAARRAAPQIYLSIGGEAKNA